MYQSWGENQDTFMFSVFFAKIVPFMRYCIVRRATDGNKTRQMRIACWLTVVTNPPSEYVIIIAFPRQQWLRERACGTYVHACLVQPVVTRPPCRQAHSSLYEVIYAQSHIAARSTTYGAKHLMFTTEHKRK